jgi:hypothetical protein
MTPEERNAILIEMEKWGTALSREDLEGNPINLAKLAFIAGWEAGRKYEINAALTIRTEYPK